MDHNLNVNPDCKPVKQKLINTSSKRIKVVREEISKLKSVGFIRKVIYPKWMEILVMVNKATREWRMCVDFTHLNSTCPKDNYPLPNIDKLIDDCSGHELYSFMDAHLSYNQVSLHKKYEEKKKLSLLNLELFVLR